MSDREKQALEAIIAEQQKEIAELEAARRKILAGISKEEIDAFNRRVGSLPY